MEIPEDKIAILDNEQYNVLYAPISTWAKKFKHTTTLSSSGNKCSSSRKEAKENQSKGGEGLTTLTKVNVRKEKADMVGCSEGTYYQSENEEIKQKVDKEEISINKAYKIIKGTDKHKT